LTPFSVLLLLLLGVGVGVGVGQGQGFTPLDVLLLLLLRACSQRVLQSAQRALHLVRGRVGTRGWGWARA
jgi:uncharacterized membrane protein YczE